MSEGVFLHHMQHVGEAFSSLARSGFLNGQSCVCVWEVGGPALALCSCKDIVVSLWYETYFIQVHLVIAK